MIPHHKKENKLDSKGDLHAVNEVCELRNCESVIFLEARKHKDVYMWLSTPPEGPSMRFLIENGMDIVYCIAHA